MAETAPNGNRINPASGDAQPSINVMVGLGPLLLADATSYTWYNRTGRPLRLERIDSFTTVAVGTADSVMTVKNNASETIGTLTIAFSGTAVAVEDEVVIPQYGTYSPIIADDEKVILAVNAAPSAGEAYYYMTFIPCIDGVS